MPVTRSEDSMSRPFGHRLWPVWVAALACSGAEFGPYTTGGIDQQYVTGAALQALDGAGFFTLGPPSDAWSTAALAEPEAAALADVFARDFVPTFPEYFEALHGKPIAYQALKRCGPTRFAESPYLEPSAGLPQGLVNAAASRWIFTYCDPTSPAVSIAVASSATGVSIVNGHFDPASLRGSEFDAEGIPMHTTAPMPPERAAEWLARASGQRVATVPRLIHPGLGYFTQSAHWMMELEASVTTSGSHAPERTFFVGRTLLTLNLEIAAPGAVHSADTVQSTTAIHVLQRRPGLERRWQAISFPRH